jgi:single-stranded-DNA-specific exonuclease
MTTPTPLWQIQPPTQPPTWLIQIIQKNAPEIPGHYAAQVLWQRGITDPQILEGYLQPNLYKPASPFEFGQEMHSAIQRLLEARKSNEKIAIWGDFDADGVTSTSVLWDGLREFFPQENLTYYIPNRRTESHGLNRPGIDKLAENNINLIITCDTGSTNLDEIEYANQLGIDMIVTDHHTLPETRPNVVAIINPRYLDSNHPLAHLSGVAVAYKFIEALYLTLPNVPKKPLEELHDLVAIGLIADLVQLSGDCRYLAQIGIQQLQKQTKNPTRLGVGYLLEFCQRNGDRPTDISFGIGPRINAVSRIHGDSSFCVELLTSNDAKRCRELVELAEIANSRRKGLQKDVLFSVKKQLEKLDLSTTSVIVLDDPQWEAGVLGLVAGQIAQEYGKPTVLLNTETSVNSEPLARGSARSVNDVDLYKLVKEQAYLLHKFGGHPFAAGLSLPVKNIPLFREGINRQLRQQGSLSEPVIKADLIVSVAELGQPLFRELKLLEPCGMGNPTPKLFIQNCWFEKVTNKNIQDTKGRKIQYIKTEFEIWDNSTKQGFPGLWWGHYKEEIPTGRCDAIVELDYNAFNGNYMVRIIALRTSQETPEFKITTQEDWIIDLRSNLQEKEAISACIFVEECPKSWDELQYWCRCAQKDSQKLALAYSVPSKLQPSEIWQELLGVAKYVSRVGKLVNRSQLAQKLGISNYTLYLGLNSLEKIGFNFIQIEQNLQILCSDTPEVNADEVNYSLDKFFAAIKEDEFRQQYFYQVPVSTIRGLVMDS